MDTRYAKTIQQKLGKMSMSGLLLLALSSIALAQNEFPQGLSFYTQEKYDEAYSQLETTFGNSQAPMVRRANAAKILAFAPNSKLKRHKRHFYAAFLLENEIQVTTKMKTTLMRIAGDGYFDEHLFHNATRFYDQLKQDADIRNQAYAEYRLAWIDLNEQRTETAFYRLANFLKTQGTELAAQDQDLLNSFARDMGRSWAEASETENPNTSLVEAFSSLKNITLSKSDISEGISMGLKRYSNPAYLEGFRKQLYQTELPDSTFGVLLQKKVVFGNFPCELQNWLTSAVTLTSERQKEILPYLNACAKKVADKKLCEKPEGKGMQELFEKMDLKDEQILPRISLSVSCEQWHRSCRDLTLLAIQHVDSKSSRPGAESVQALYETCSHSIAEGPKANTQMVALVSSELKAHFPELNQKLAEKNLLPKDAKDPLHLLTEVALQDSTIKNAISEELIKSPDTYSKSLLPETLASTLEDSERLDIGAKLLPIYSKAPVTGIWFSILETLVHSKMKEAQTQDAKNLMDQYIPMSEAVAKNSDYSALWQFVWLGLEEQERLPEEAKIALWSQSVSFTKMKADERVRAFVLLFSVGHLDTIWTHWSTFAQAARTKKDLLAAFYQQTLEQISSDKTEEPTQKKSSVTPALLSKTEEGKTLIRLSKQDTTLTMKQIEKVLHAPVAMTGDVQSLDKLRTLSRKFQGPTLKLNGLFAQRLSNRLKALQNEEKHVLSTGWTNPGFKTQAYAILTADSQSLAKQLEKARDEASKTPELAEVTEQIAQIINQIQTKIEEYAK